MKKVLSLVLALTMVLCLCQTFAFAGYISGQQYLWINANDDSMGTVKAYTNGKEVYYDDNHYAPFPGDEITLEATPNSGYKFVRWETEDEVDVSSGTFTMPTTETTITAIFEKDIKPISEISVTFDTNVAGMKATDVMKTGTLDAKYGTIEHVYITTNNGCFNDLSTAVLEEGKNYVLSLFVKAPEGYYYNNEVEPGPPDEYEFISDVSLDLNFDSPYTSVKVGCKINVSQEEIQSNTPINDKTTGLYARISFEFTATKRPIPKIIEGQNQETTVDTDKNAKFRSDAPFADFIEVQVDGKVVAPSNYKASEGSTIIELLPSFLKTLSVGKHTLAIVSKGGSANTTFTIVEEEVIENTDMPLGFVSTATVAMTMASVTVLGLGLVVLGTKKERDAE